MRGQGIIEHSRAGGIALGIGLLLVACAETEEPPLTADEREEVARVYADSVRALTEAVDSACRARRPQLTLDLADSLYEVRLADIERQEAVLR